MFDNKKKVFFTSIYIVLDFEKKNVVSYFYLKDLK